MTDKSNLTKSPDKSKHKVVSDNRQTTKPYSEFPLTPHRGTGRWCKKVRGKLWYFGSFADGWEAALNRYKDEIDDIMAGRIPEARNKDGLRLMDLLNRFLHFKRGLVATGELTMRSWFDYHQTAERLMKVFGKDRLVEDLGPADFEKLRADYGTTWGAVRVGNEINRARMVFRYAFESGLLDKPIRFGPGFKRPSRKTLRKVRAKARHKDGARMFTAEELRKIIGAAPQPLRSMVFLGINGGLNNMDVGMLPMSALNLEGGWLNYPRPKTGVDRRIPLWPETLAALREWLASRPAAKKAEDAQLVFLSKRQRPMHRVGRFGVDKKGIEVVRDVKYSPVSKSFRYVLKRLDINGKRNFLALRHTFRTIGRGARDREAIDSLMGHADESMAAHYIEDGLPDERLRAVTEHIHTWLFATAATAEA